MRIGSVGYINARPLTDAIDRTAWDVVSDHPAAIAARLHSGDVDLALVPVAAILDGGDWRIVGGVCIGADGPVDSVLLVAETALEDWTELVLDGESRTSAVLARLLLARGPLSERVRDGLSIRSVDPGTGVALATGTTAALVIGDAAMELPDRLTTRIDLAQTWKEWTGLPFVFAVWAGRSTVDPSAVTHLRVAGEAGVAAIAQNWDGAKRVYLTERIRYTLDDRALMGLRRFASLAKQAGLLASEHLELFGPSHDRIPRPEGLDDLLERALDGHALAFEDALRLETAAPMTLLAGAADIKRALQHPDGVVRYRRDWDLGQGDIAELVVGAGESGADRVRAILALREGRADRVRVVAADNPGTPAASQANTAVDYLRAVALARLLLDVPHLEASASTEGIGMAQTSLRAGCDHLGTVRDIDVAEIERQIRDAGFEPVADQPLAAPPVGTSGVAARG